MQTSDHNPHNLTEADRTSQTRFGPRPVPEGHKTASPYPHRPMQSSRVIPSGPMSPDGKSAYPTPSTASKIVVWGGVALGVAGLTAGAVMVARKLSEPSRDERSRRPVGSQARGHGTLAPRFDDLDEDEREEMRRRVRSRARLDQAQAAQMRALAARGRHPGSGNVARDLSHTASDLSTSIEGLTGSLLSAFNGFRSVATQATGLVGEFAAAAEQVRSLLGRGADAGSARAGSGPAPARDDPRRHRL